MNNPRNELCIVMWSKGGFGGLHQDGCKTEQMPGIMFSFNLVLWQRLQGNLDFVPKGGLHHHKNRLGLQGGFVLVRLETVGLCKCGM